MGQTDRQTSCSFVRESTSAQTGSCCKLLAAASFYPYLSRSLFFVHLYIYYPRCPHCSTQPTPRAVEYLKLQFLLSEMKPSPFFCSAFSGRAFLVNSLRTVDLAESQNKRTGFQFSAFLGFKWLLAVELYIYYNTHSTEYRGW